MAEAYKTILREGRDEFTVSRSRFIGWSKPVSSEEDALAFIEGIRKAHWDATHNVWAYKLGTDRERFSDDGEPRGTAGVPVLEAVRKGGLQDVAVVVTRYFGGVKLGAGGLVRAYTRGASIALEAGEVILRRPYLSFEVVAGYPFAEKFRREFARRGYPIKSIAYADQVSIMVLVAPEESEALRMLVTEFTAGRGVLLACPDEYLNESAAI